MLASVFYNSINPIDLLLIIKELPYVAGASRGVASVISTILLIGIVVVLTATISVFILGLGENLNSTVPSAAFDVEENANGTVVVTHIGGDQINHENLVMKGGVINDAPETLQAGSSIKINPTDETVTIVWDAKESSAILTSFPAASVDTFTIDGSDSTIESLNGTRINANERVTVKNTGEQCIRMSAERVNNKSISPQFTKVKTKILPGETRSIPKTTIDYDIKITSVKRGCG